MNLYCTYIQLYISLGKGRLVFYNYLQEGYLTRLAAFYSGKAQTLLNTGTVPEYLTAV